jgi:hypothetical protein
MIDLMLPLPGLSPVSGKTVVAKFDGGLLSSDGGNFPVPDGPRARQFWRLSIHSQRNKDSRRTEPLETSPRQADCRNLPREALPPNNR